MDQDHVPDRSDAEHMRGDDVAEPSSVASRRRALDRLRSRRRRRPCGPILITGEPGAGKTWLTHQLAGVLPSGWQSARVDLTRRWTHSTFFN